MWATWPPVWWNRSGRTLSGRCALITIASAAVLSFDVGSHQLLTNDDTRFPVLARDVLANGRWLVPAFPDGARYLNKPPLGIWLIALTSWPGGMVTARTAILPSLVESIGMVLLTYVLGRRLFGPSSGVVAGLTVCTMVGVHSSAISPMPDMAQLVACTGALALYGAFSFGEGRAWLIPFYGVVGIGTLAKGPAGFLPLAIALIHAVTSYGSAGLKRLISIPGWLALGALSVPWWIAAAGLGGSEQFVHGSLVNDKLITYFGREGSIDQTILEPFLHAITVVLPWGLLLPLAIRRTFGRLDRDTYLRVRLVLVWLATAFVIMAVSGRQRERYYLPLCPAAALLIGWWYSTLVWKHRRLVFAGTWIAVALVGCALIRWDNPRVNAGTDLRDLRAILPQKAVPLFSVDLQDLALTFNLNRPVLSTKDYRRFAALARRGTTGYLLISDRALDGWPFDRCMRGVARGLVTRQPFTVLDSSDCAGATSWPPTVTTREPTGAAK